MLPVISPSSETVGRLEFQFLNISVVYVFFFRLFGCFYSPCTNDGYVCVFLGNPDMLVIPVDLTGSEKVDPPAASLLEPGIIKTSNSRYPTSEFRQFWIVLKRTLLFSRRDWVCSPSWYSCCYHSKSFCLHSWIPCSKIRQLSILEEKVAILIFCS